MVDIVDAETRSRMMANIGRASTRPELLVRRYLHGAGLRYRLNDRSLPGSPDIVLPRHRSVVFVHGCFWHRHRGCRYTATPGTRPEFWEKKFSANVKRDLAATVALREVGWNVFVIWECEVRDELALDHLFWAIVAAESPS